MSEKLTSRHLERKAILYIRQSSSHQVLHNEESRRLQYAMKQRLCSLGWSDIEIIDDDLGRSASGTTQRSGFERMVAEVCLGKVGAVAAREVSRFARNSREWHQLVEMCSLVDAVLVDHDTIYDPRASNDRLLLGLKGSLSEYELDLLRHRSLEARRSKAARGELIITAPAGYDKAEGGLEKDPDRRVQRTIALVFSKCLELGSARQTLMWLIERGFDVPVKHRGLSGWTTIWKRPTYHRILRILRNPIYAGAYTYGRTEMTSTVRDGMLHKTVKTRPVGQYAVLIHDHHVGYVSREQFERIQEMISDNVCKEGAGAAREGTALLSGLLRCRRCGRKLMVLYTGRNHSVPRYCCHRGNLDNGEPRCIGFGGVAVDDAVGSAVLRVVEPGALEAAAQAVEESLADRAKVLEALQLEVQAARYAADRAQRQYDGVDPGNRLVADELESRWNTALSKLAQAEERLEAARGARPQGETPDVKSMIVLARNLESVWKDPHADVRLKKRIVRTLIEEIVADVDEEASQVVVVVHWKGGVHSELRVARRRRGENTAHTSKDTVDAVRVLARICPDEVIASFLSRNGLQTGRGNRWTKERVTSLRSYYKIPRYRPEARKRDGWLNLSEAAEYLGTSTTTLRLAIERGDVDALHPLPNGPWLLRRDALDRSQVRARFERLRSGTRASEPSSSQLDLGISSR
jgi:DNA invertase Pin-like site-specific DNA recombinase